MAVAAQQKASVEITASSRTLAAKLREARQKFGRWGKDVEGVTEKATKGRRGGGVRALGRSAGGILGAAAGIAGVGSLAGIAGDAIDLDRAITQFGITANRTPAQLQAIKDKAVALSSALGTNSQEVLAGAQTYVDATGDAEGATAAMESFARIAKASNTPIQDVASATAALRDSMGLKAGDIEAVFSGMIVQGKEGAVTLSNFASQLNALAPQFARFKGGQSPEGIRQLGAALQVAKKGFGSAAEAANGFERFMGDIGKGATLKRLKKLKVNPFDKKGARKGFDEILNDLMGKGLTDKQLSGLFESKEAGQFFLMMKNNMGLYDQLKAKAADAGAVQRDLMTVQQSASGKLDIAVQKLKNSIAEAFTPERIEMFATALGGVLNVIGSIGEGAKSVGEEIAKMWMSVEEQRVADMANRLDEMWPEQARGIVKQAAAAREVQAKVTGDDNANDIMQAMTLVRSSNATEAHAGRNMLMNATPADFAKALATELQRLIGAGNGQTTVTESGDIVYKANKKARKNGTRPAH